MDKSVSPGVAAAINLNWEANESGHRPHLGASQIGKPCERALSYSFRHAVPKKTQGRMLRLFNRGHLEEVRLVDWLRRVGMEVREFAQRLTYHEASASYGALEWEDPVAAEMLARGELVDVSDKPAHVEVAKAAGVELRQWQFGDVGGHFSGSTDGKARVPPESLRQFPALGGEWFGLEFKTYNTKGFTSLVAERSVRKFRPEHYVQMQVYMHYMGLPRCLYLAINKNDDDLYDEVVEYDRTAAEEALTRAARVVGARQLPPRLSNNSTNFACRFCDYRGVCHFGDEMVRSCRTCAHGIARVDRTDRTWHCARWQSDIPREVVPKGCDQWQPVTD